MVPRTLLLVTVDMRRALLQLGRRALSTRAELPSPARRAIATSDIPAGAPEELRNEESGVQSTYTPYDELDLGGSPHPTRLVETTALASGMRPQPRARIFAGTIVPVGLSNVQLEAIALATDAHDDEDVTVSV